MICSAAIVLALYLLLVGCSAGPAGPTLSPTAALASPTALPTTSEAPITPSPAATASTTINLTVWAPEEFSPEAARGGQVLQRQLEDFTLQHPGIRVNYALKNRYGTGGILDFLLQVQSLVPGRLPDLIVLDSKQTDAALAAELLQPLERDLPAGALADLFPPVQEIARPGGRWMVLPWVLEVQHLAYNKQITPKPPTTWDQLLAANAPFAFPADDDDAFLFQYLQNHGRLSIARQPTPLDATVIMTVLTFFQQARNNKQVPDSTLAVKTVHDVWPLFADGQAALAQVEASDYWAGMARVTNAGYAPLPTQDGSATTLISSWNYAIVTNDPARHAAAAALLNWLDEPSRLTEWAAAAYMIPARRSAFVSAVTPSDYADFIRKLVETGMIAPSLAERAPYASGWHAALQAVLRGQSTPAEVAPKAAQAATP